MGATGGRGRAGCPERAMLELPCRRGHRATYQSRALGNPIFLPLSMLTFSEQYHKFSDIYVLDTFQLMFLLSESMLPTIHPRSYYHLILQKRKPRGGT